MGDLISRQAALKGFAKYSDAWCYINALPTAEPKRGKWIVLDGQVVCSECYNANIETNYCPNCGARMEE